MNIDFAIKCGIAVSSATTFLLTSLQSNRTEKRRDIFIKKVAKNAVKKEIIKTKK